MFHYFVIQGSIPSDQLEAKFKKSFVFNFYSLKILSKILCLLQLLLKLSQRASIEQEEHSVLLFSGIFTASIAGVYSVSMHTFSVLDHSKLNIKKNPASGSGEQEVCSAHVDSEASGAATCEMYVELAVGDELYAKGDYNIAGALFAPPGEHRFVSLLVHLLYAANPLN